MQNASHISWQFPVRAAKVLGLALALAALAPAAYSQEAQPSPQRAERALQQQRDLQREMQRQEMLRQEQRAYEEQQRRLLQAQQEQQQEGQRRNGRMTADERSELRRQINEANQDIYARPRGRR